MPMTMIINIDVTAPIAVLTAWSGDRRRRGLLAEALRPAFRHQAISTESGQAVPLGDHLSIACLSTKVVPANKAPADKGKPAIVTIASQPRRSGTRRPGRSAIEDAANTTRR
jgi:hypothetical protein